MAMVIADVVVTPAMSVVSAVDGLKVGISGIKQEEVVMIAVAFLIVLYSVQKYGTSKMGFVIGPALFVWLCCLAGIGIYNLVKYDRDVWRAFNPIHIYYFFKRKKIEAWYALGGCLLCATGSEAMFADLCYFSVRSVQLTFEFLVFPCLLLGYLRQAAYLMQNQGDYTQVFYSSVPSTQLMSTDDEVGALTRSRSLTTPLDVDQDNAFVTPERMNTRDYIFRFHMQKKKHNRHYVLFSFPPVVITRYYAVPHVTISLITMIFLGGTHAEVGTVSQLKKL